MSNLHLDDKEIWRLSQEGFSQREIAIVMKCSKTTIRNHLNKIKEYPEILEGRYPAPKKGDRTKKNIPLDKIIEMHETGFTDQEIADFFGCRRHNITARLNKAGFNDRKDKIDNIALRNKISETLKGTGLGPENARYLGTDGQVSLKQRARGLAKTIKNEKLRNSNYVCAACGSKSRVLEVHHIKPFQLILDEFLVNSYSGNLDTFTRELSKYSDFTNLDNLVVLCPTCHRELHYTDNPELSPFRWESATTIENLDQDLEQEMYQELVE